MVTKLEDNHTFRLDLTHNVPQKLSSKIIANFFKKRILDDGSIMKLRAMITELLGEYGIEVECNVTLQARNLAIEMVYNFHDQSFAILPAYLEILKRDDQGYSFRHCHKGRFSLAIGVGPIKNDVAWIWFMDQFKRAFGDRDDLVIVSN
ncbi:hypothetical protein C2S51_000469 [Perilla frutescens var. frutescens]|nr:hypothetical protein C2S51_000469 [Perilla frutescens var. frutescens]